MLSDILSKVATCFIFNMFVGSNCNCTCMLVYCIINSTLVLSNTAVHKTIKYFDSMLNVHCSTSCLFMGFWSIISLTHSKLASSTLFLQVVHSSPITMLFHNHICSICHFSLYSSTTNTTHQNCLSVWPFGSWLSAYRFRFD